MMSTPKNLQREIEEAEESKIAMASDQQAIATHRRPDTPLPTSSDTTNSITEALKVNILDILNYL